MRQFIIKQAVYTKNKIGKFITILELSLNPGTLVYKNIIKKAEEILYREKKRNTVIVVEKKKVVWIGKKEDDGQALINLRNND